MSDRYAIVIDGTASLAPGMDRELDIRPLPLHVDLGTDSYTSGVDLTAEEFYKKIAAPGVKPGTSQPSMGECREVYDKLIAEGTKKMIVLTIANELSGTYSVASATAQQVGDARIEVVDTRTLAGAISLIATACARARRDGRTFDDAVRLARRLAGKVHLLDVAGGKLLRTVGKECSGCHSMVSGGAALFGSLLAVKPILEVDDGVVAPIDRVRTREKAIARLKELIEQRLPPGSRVNACTLHTNDPERALALADWAQARFHCVEHWMAEAGPVIGARAGPGVIGLCWYRSEDAV